MRFSVFFATISIGIITIIDNYSHDAGDDVNNAIGINHCRPNVFFVAATSTDIVDISINSICAAGVVEVEADALSQADRARTKKILFSSILFVSIHERKV